LGPVGAKFRRFEEQGLELGVAVDDYLSDKEQVALIREWWRDNGRFVLTGLGLGLAILFGWRAWENHVRERAESASGSYSSLLEAVEQRDRDRALDLGQSLIDDYDDTPYAGQAALALAKLHVLFNELEDAETHLRWALGESDDQALRQVATLRLARVLMQLERGDEALTVLDKSDTGAFTAQLHELRGDIQVALGDDSAARVEYESALNAAEGSPIDQNLLQIKLDSLINEGLPEADVAGGDSTEELVPAESGS